MCFPLAGILLSFFFSLSTFRSASPACSPSSSAHHTKMLPGPALVVMATRKGGSVMWPAFLGFWLARSGEVRKGRRGRGRCQTPSSSQIGGILSKAACKHTDTKDVILRWSYPEVQLWLTNLESRWYLARWAGLSLSSHLQSQPARVQYAEITLEIWKYRMHTGLVKTADLSHIHLLHWLQHPIYRN